MLKAKNILFYLYIWSQENKGKCSDYNDCLNYPQTARVLFGGKKDRSEVCEFLDEIKKALLSCKLIWPEFLHLYFSVIHSPFGTLDQASWHTFFAKWLIVNIFDLADHVVSVATAQLCHCSVKAAIGNM